MALPWGIAENEGGRGNQGAGDEKTVRIRRMHAHRHSHAHGHSAHGGMKGVLGWAVVVTALFVVAEFAGGYFGRSLALVSDAVHNLSDIPTLVISWVALRLAERPPTAEKTYGYQRAGILAAFTNAIVLALVALYIVWEAVQRLLTPETVRTDMMIWLSIAGLAVNGGISLAVVRARKDLNLRTILVHNFGDALSNVGILIGALAIGWSGAVWIDPMLGMGIGALVLWSSIGILRESSHILLEGFPRGMKLEDVAEVILSVEGVQEIHDVHVWTLGTELYALSCHMRLPDMHMEEIEKILREIETKLEKKLHITHVTIQFERAGLAASSGYYMPEPAKKES